MNIKQTLTYGLAALTLALTPARAAPPQPNAQGRICLPPAELERVCRENYCPPAPDCPSKVAAPRIPRSKCADHYKESTGVGICLHTDDAERLSSLEGVILEKGPDNLCPWGGNYHCYELDVEKVKEYVDRPVDRVVEKRVEVKVTDPATQQSLEEARRRIKELEGRKPTSTPVYVVTPQKPGNEVTVDFGGLANVTADDVTDAANIRVGYHHALGKYFLLGVDGMFLLGEDSTKRSVSNGQELLPDGNRKSWTDTTSTERDGFSGGVGGVLGVRVPFVELDDGTQFYVHADGGLYALFGKVSGDKKRTTDLSLPDGTVFMGPKTISEPQPKEIEVMLGVMAGLGVGVRLPLGGYPDSPAFIGNAGVQYLFIRGKDNPHYVGGKLGMGLEF